MSARANGADGHLVVRLTVGMTEQEHAELLRVARTTGLSLARYLVAAGRSAPQLRPEIRHFGPVEERIRGPRGQFSVFALWLFKSAPCCLARKRMARGSKVDDEHRMLRPEAIWIDHASLGDVVVWELHPLAAREEEGGLIRDRAPAAEPAKVAFRIGVVESRRVHILGWQGDRDQAAEIVDGVLSRRARLILPNPPSEGPSR